MIWALAPEVLPWTLSG